MRIYTLPLLKLDCKVTKTRLYLYLLASSTWCSVLRKLHSELPPGTDQWEEEETDRAFQHYCPCLPDILHNKRQYPAVWKLHLASVCYLWEWSGVINFRSLHHTNWGGMYVNCTASILWQALLATVVHSRSSSYTVELDPLPTWSFPTMGNSGRSSMNYLFSSHKHFPLD